MDFPQMVSGVPLVLVVIGLGVKAAIGLLPGASRSFRCGVQFEPVMPPLVAVGDAPGSPRTKVAGNG